MLTARPLRRATSHETEAVKAVFGDTPEAGVRLHQVDDRSHARRRGRSGVHRVAAVLHRGVIPPTINQCTPDPECDLDSAPNRKVERRVDVALSNSFGFGGHNVTLAVKRWES